MDQNFAFLFIHYFIYELYFLKCFFITPSDLQWLWLALQQEHKTQIFRSYTSLSENKWVNSHSSHTEISAVGAAGSKSTTKMLGGDVFPGWSKLEKGTKVHLSLHNIAVLIFHIRLPEICLRGNRRITFHSPSVTHILHHTRHSPTSRQLFSS